MAGRGRNYFTRLAKTTGFGNVPAVVKARKTGHTWPPMGFRPYLCGVRKAFAAFFLTIMLLVQSPLQQVLRLPVLVAHFTEHKIRSNGEISFLQFINHHYFTTHPDDGDTDRDQQLPFRASEVVMINSTVVVPGQILPEFEPLVFIEEAYPLLTVTGPSSLFAFDIWQPPKSC